MIKLLANSLIDFPLIKCLRCIRPESDADFADGLKAANAGPVAGVRIDDDERPAPQGRFQRPGENLREHVTGRPWQRVAVDDEFHPIFVHVPHRRGLIGAVLVAALEPYFTEQHDSLCWHR